MNNWNVLIATILLLGATVFASQAVLPEKKSLNAANASLTLPNVKELVTFVDSAVAYAKENGKEKALKEFNNKTGPFVKGERYIFALDFNGPIATFKKDLIGKN